MFRDTSRYKPIGEYAVIGDCRSAALISGDGSLDWLCWPRFDSPSVFAALLDSASGGCFAIRPTGRYQTRRRYLPDTAVLETTFENDRGVARLVDLMPVAAPMEKRGALWPDHEVMRRIECVAGEIEIEIICDPRPDYGRVTPRLQQRGSLGLFYEHGSKVLALRSEVPLQLSNDRSDARATVRLRQGENRHISLAYAHGEPAVLPALGPQADERIERSIQWWRRWLERCPYDGPFRGAVERSALTLKLLTYAPSGAVVAAATTSLPEDPGGERNWDYRYCWLRDASLTLQALFDLGYEDEGGAFLSWLLHTTRMTRPGLQVVYDVFGEKRLKERELTHLEGYGGARPVRIGNAAVGQLQLDVYGEVVDAVYEFVCRGGRLDRQTARLLTGLGKTVCRRWREPDEGIWEVRGGRRQHTYSKAMCWVALDRLIRLHEEGHLTAPVARFSSEQSAIREAVEARGFNADLQSYVATFDGDDVDASLLQLARYGYADAKSPRMLSTVERIDQRLGRDGLLYRYLNGGDGLSGREAAFGVCGFWGVATRARQGEIDQAMRRMSRLVALANDVGLFAEEIDPGTGSAVGNFPQAFTHLGLIDAALTLDEVTGGPKRGAAARAAEARI